MTRNEVVALIGEPKAIYGLARNRVFVWSYPYVNTFCFWFNAEFTAENVVRSTGYSKPPKCKIRGENKTSLAAPHIKTAGLQTAKANALGGGSDGATFHPIAQRYIAAWYQLASRMAAFDTGL